jgi:hypothetical protein
MKTRFRYLRQLALPLLGLLPLGSCTYNDELLEAARQQQEFVFSLEDIQGYQNWTVLGYSDRPDIGQFRTIYINKPEEAGREQGAYPVGTIIIKEGRDYNDRSKIVRFQIMAKRGGGFNPLGNGWEWSLVDSDDLSLANNYRGDNSILLGTATCYSCHAGHNDLVIKGY